MGGAIELMPGTCRNCIFGDVDDSKTPHTCDKCGAEYCPRCCGVMNMVAENHASQCECAPANETDQD